VTEFLGFLFGYDSGIISSTIVQPHFEAYMGTPTSSQTGGIVSSFTGGAIPGALSVAWLPDKLGRRKTVFIGACISVLGCALQGGAKNIPMMIAGRFIAGIAVGLLSAVVPMYCVSFSPQSPWSLLIQSAVRNCNFSRSWEAQWLASVDVVLGLPRCAMARLWVLQGEQ
jgi:MFS family permease